MEASSKTGLLCCLSKVLSSKSISSSAIAAILDFSLSSGAAIATHDFAARSLELRVNKELNS